MILYLRNKKNETIVDIEIYIKSEDDSKFVELHSTVVIEPYSSFLLENLDNAEQIIFDFQEISELRSWMWEKYFAGKNDPTKIKYLIEDISFFLKNISEKYNLKFITD